MPNIISTKKVCYHNNMRKIETELSFIYACEDCKQTIATITLGERRFND